MNPSTGLGEGFQQDADKYAAYLETTEGRLRLDLAFASLEEFLPVPPSSRSLRALDLGGGTGATAVRLARLGVHVTLLDSSAAMLQIAERSAREAQVADRISLRPGDVSDVAKLFPAASFDVVVCHDVLEYVEDPDAVLRDAARLLRRDITSILSVLVRNRAGEVLKAAIQSGDLEAADKALTAAWGVESLYGGRVRFFTPEDLLVMAKDASLEVVALQGVRVVADYLSPQISRETEYARIVALERELGRRPEFAAIARYTQLLLRPAELPHRE